VKGLLFPFRNELLFAESAILQFVIPSEAEGSAVRRWPHPIPRPRPPNRIVIPTGA
jgi:hypothetical protein